MHRFRSRASSFLILLGIFWYAGCGSAQQLTILHWNDFHAQNVPRKLMKKTEEGSRVPFEVGGYAYLKAYLERERASAPENIVLHAGDDFQGTPASSLTKGKSQIELLNLVAPDVMTLGNHEFDYGTENLRALLPLARFPIVSANIWDKTKGSTFVPPCAILDRGMLRIGVIGLAPSDLARLTLRENVKDFDVLDPATVVRRFIRELRDKQGVNLIVILSHMGVVEDSILASQVEGIDVIIGGHSHTPLFHPKRVKGVVICQAGEKGRYLGRLDLTFDPEKGKIVSSDGRLIEVASAEIAPDTAVAAKVAEFEKIVDANMGERIGTLKKDWIRKPHGESNVGDWQTDAMLEYSGADVAFQNAGGIRKNLAAGPILVRDIWEMNPFGNRFVTFQVTGAQLRSMVEWQMTLEAEGFCQIGGIRVAADRSLPKMSRVTSLRAGEMEIDPLKGYTVVTNNYVAGHLHDFFGLPEKEITLREILPTMQDREVFIRHLRSHPEVEGITDGRLIMN